MRFESNHAVIVGEVSLVNATPHSLTFSVGEDVVSIPPVEGLAKVISATPAEKVYMGNIPGCQIVSTTFLPSQEGVAYLQSVPSHTLIVGSIIAAQAFRYPVVALVTVPGFERVPPEQKRMRADKFTAY